MEKYKGRIVEVSKGIGGYKGIFQEIEKDQQPFYDKNFRGSNGSYLVSDETFPVIDAVISVYDFDNKAIKVDIREIVRNHYKWQRITIARISLLKSKLVGKKVTIINADGEEKIENLESML
jgi:hypothetical protein